MLIRVHLELDRLMWTHGLTLMMDNEQGLRIAGCLLVDSTIDFLREGSARNLGGEGTAWNQF
jgi:hypothetical protein